MTNDNNQDLRNIESLQIRLASTEEMLKWSYGEVTKPETINYRSLKPEYDGLFCERIFGPTKDWVCGCGKYNKIRYKGLICPTCKVEVTKAKVRRERMGHIQLVSPVSHIWYFKGIPSRIGLVLDMSPKDLEKVLYFANYVITDLDTEARLEDYSNGTLEAQKISDIEKIDAYYDARIEEENAKEEPREWLIEDCNKRRDHEKEIRKKALEGLMSLEHKKIFEGDEEVYRKMEECYGKGKYFTGAMGAEAIKTLLEAVDVDKTATEIREELKTASGQKRNRLVKILEAIEAFKQSGNRPEWMILDVIPVIPPDLRPMVQLDGGRFATSDLNDLYRRVINRNNRLKKLFELGAPDIIVRNEKRMLQESVDALIDNGRRGRAVTGAAGRKLKSLSDMLKGKQGRFRQNLLGKRVDFSGRSVIVVGPDLKFYQCGLPKTMALELFKPFIMKELAERGLAHNAKNARTMVEKGSPEVWDILDYVIKDHPVLLNRAPTLHRLGIQAFEPVLVEGKAIRLHPLVCTAFTAAFDGDQMAVHVPLSVEAQAEARFLMLSVNNILAPKDGSPITIPTQDMILGSYYLTHPGSEERNRPAEKGDGKCFADMDEMMMAYQAGIVGIHAKVKVRRFAYEGDPGQLVESTVGRFIFNEGLPQDLGFVDREKDPYSLEVDFLCEKKALGRIIAACFKAHGNTDTVLMLDYIKSIGYHYSTISAVTISISDMEIPEAKAEIVGAAEKIVDTYEQLYRRGLMSNKERYEQVIKTWKSATDHVADALMESLGSMNNLYIMAHSGARGNKSQISQVGGMRGLMANATGHTVEIPIKANFREGLSILEYFISSNGARKGLADTALRTADSGYLTRRLVDISHSIIVNEDDCGTDEGVEVRAFREGKEEIEKLWQRISGRYAFEDIVDPATGEVLVAGGEYIDEDDAKEIEARGIETVMIRSAMTCHAKKGICAKCYGKNMATGRKVLPGEAVGIIAAQSIGEPGTQLTMRTFHTGGVAGSDITQGLPRVEELFEARKPKGLAEICEADGEVVEIEPREDNKTNVVVHGVDGEDRVYEIPFGARITHKVGDKIKAGDGITKGPLDPHDIMRLTGVQGVYEYLLREVQKVYKTQGVDINDKHVEIIVSQMLSKYKVVKPGDTTLLPGGQYSRFEIQDANEAAEAEGGEPATVERQLLGITKAALATNSFLSAASFQETTRVLTDASIKGKTDRLEGLKENVMIGKLIPAGTGMKTYRNIEVDYGENAWMMEQNREEAVSEEAYSAEESAEISNAETVEEETPMYGDAVLVEE
ncbi:MAG: DNA-directed RNA polymerase subunit beta' [Clostridiales bacterium]|nr:DNA-directed RNA polymerase subunit beta' [Candidatus Crickella caballi]